MFFLKGPVHKLSALSKVIAWCWTGSKPLPEPTMTKMTLQGDNEFTLDVQNCFQDINMHLHFPPCLNSEMYNSLKFFFNEKLVPAYVVESRLLMTWWCLELGYWEPWHCPIGLCHCQCWRVRFITKIYMNIVIGLDSYWFAITLWLCLFWCGWYDM